MSATLRVGIDVGGTFTDVVAIDPSERRVVARVKVPTTHGSANGIADGIVAGLHALLEQPGISASQIAFIAHSTTQATNAILEGDLANVGIVGLTSGISALSRLHMSLGPMHLAPGAAFTPKQTFAPAGDAPRIRACIDALVAAGVDAIAVSNAFSVDAPAAETMAVGYAREKNVAATSGHEVSSQYGLRARTRTAALNAAILPTMLRTSRTTAQAVSRAGITAPLMVMRSDGGVMEVGEIERRPILTLLSGPAAGISGALLHENVTDGIFIEVGGTSSDCSVIRSGRPQLRAARIGGARTMLRTLDVRTLAIAGGSMVRCNAQGIHAVGPRSAHIAGARYAVFCTPEDLIGAQIAFIAPTPRDPNDYAVLRTRDGGLVTVTPTCAANLLGFVPEGDFARGNIDAATAAFSLLAQHYGGTAQQQAEKLLEIATTTLLTCVDELIADYALDAAHAELIGGGGGASSLVPAAAVQREMKFRIARDAEVISPVGVALALVRESVERTLVNPSADELRALRAEAAERVVASGADSATIEVHVEIDTQRNRVRATASGAIGNASDATATNITREERMAIAQRVTGATNVNALASTGGLEVFVAGRELRVLDMRGVVRLGLRDAQVALCTSHDIAKTLASVMEAATRFGDVGRAAPDLFVLVGSRIADFSGFARADDAIALAEEEIRGRDPAAPIILLAVPKNA
ncbi:MAG: hydantoinase/oxoprolinase family protein [Vulcanimicrobiaceae bacterium]